MELRKHLRAVLLLPGMVLVVIPATIVYFTGFDSFGVWQSVPATRVIFPFFGGVSLLIGLSLMIATNWLFATIAKGTLAPWDPTQRLVVVGIYRHVRNPMMSGVFFVLIGEVLLTASWQLAVWFAIFVGVNLIFIPLWEEPFLARRFGDEYREYKQNVPRWIARISPWKKENM